MSTALTVWPVCTAWAKTEFLGAGMAAMVNVGFWGMLCCDLFSILTGTVLLIFSAAILCDEMSCPSYFGSE